MADDADNQKPTDGTDTPPWGDEFDAEKAWKLIQNLRSDKADLQSKITAADEQVASFETERQAREDQGKTAEQKATDALAAAEKRAADAERKLYVEAALRKHKVHEDLVEFLTGDTAEAVMEKAERLAKIGAPDGDAEKTPPAPDIPPRPTPGLTPGHGGTDSAPKDLDAIVAAARSRA